MSILDTILPKHVVRCSHAIYFGDARKVKSIVPGTGVHLVVTSPPYGNLKDYGHGSQLGRGQSLAEYQSQLARVLGDCVDLLLPGCYLCVNIGNEFVPAGDGVPYHTVPHYECLVADLSRARADVFFLGTIIWVKRSTTNTSGGGKIMGSYFAPNPRFFQNREYILVFAKAGKRPDDYPDEVKMLSGWKLCRRRGVVRGVWADIPPVRQDIHLAMFPKEIPARLIEMYTLVGDTVLDPFAGSGTTTLAAAMAGRNSVGVEIGFDGGDKDWREVIREKVTVKQVTKRVRYEHAGKSVDCLIDIRNRFNFADAGRGR